MSTKTKDKEQSIKELLTWILHQGFKHVAIVQPHLTATIPTVIGAALRAVLQTRDVVREQQALVDLFVVAIRCLPKEVKPRIFVVEDSPKKIEQVKFRQKTDLIVVVHPVNPGPLTEVRGPCIVSVCFRKD